MFVICDILNNILYSARDPFGVRPGFIGYDKEEVYICSEAKSLPSFCNKIIPFKPGAWWSSENNTFTTFYFLKIKDNNNDINSIYDNVNNLLKEQFKICFFVS